MKSNQLSYLLSQSQIIKVMRIQDSTLSERDIRAFDLVTEAKLANFAKLAGMLIDLLGLDDAFQKYVKPKREGQEVEIEFTSLGGSIKFFLTRERKNFDPQLGKAENPVAKLTITVKREKATLTFSKIIRSKSNLFGLIKIVPLLLMRKIRIKGSLAASIALI